MNKKTCKAIRLEIEEGNFNEPLQCATSEHLRLCAECREFYESELKLRQLVASIPQVEAPSDFDFRLRARLANERSRSSISFASLGVPSVVGAGLILLLGGVLVVRNMINSRQTPAFISSGVDKNAVKEVPANSPLPAASEEAQSDAPHNRPDEPSGPRRNPQLAKVLANQRNRSIARDSSSVGATVVRRDTAIAGAQFPLLFPMQTLKVSVNDGRGVARTISFPTVSFGSERVLTRAGNSFQGSVKGDW